MNKELHTPAAQVRIMGKSKFFLSFACFIILYSLFFTKAHAQTLDPNTWQNGSVGLKAKNVVLQKSFSKQLTRKMTAGQVISVGTDANPFLMVSKDGVTDAGWNHLQGPTGLDLGEVKIVGQAPFALSSESTSWARNEMTFSNGTSQIKVTASRLTPAVLIQNSTSPVLDFLAGNVYGDTTSGGPIASRPLSPSSPKYVAYSSGGTFQTKTLSSTATSLPSLDNNWVLVWYGTNSHLVSTKRPLNYENMGQGNAYQVDVPVLFTFQNNPTSVKNSSEGGVEFSFTSSAGSVSLMPLFGKEHQKVSVTEAWGTSGLPQTVKDKIAFWAPRSCNFPSNVSESYSYDASQDKATITDTFVFIPVCSNPAKFAPIPPMLGIAKDAFGANLTFSGNLVNANTSTDIGPTFGIDNVSTYSWSLSGLKKYTDNKRVVSGGSVPPELSTELNSEIDKLLEGGHFAPWESEDALPTNLGRGDIYFLNPADNLYPLIEMAESMPDSTDPNNPKNKLINYIKSEKSSFPPETVFNLPNQGTVRSGFNQNNYTYWQANRQDWFLKRVPVYNFYSLSRYYDLTKESISAAVVSAGKTALDNDLKEMDWANLYWFDGFAEKRIAVVSSSRHLAGLVGLSRILQKGSDPQEGLSRALLAKAAVQRVAFAKYPRYLYSNNLIEIPADPAWQPKTTAWTWFGSLFNYNWVQPIDDARQVTLLNQFGVTLHDNSGVFSITSGFYAPEWTLLTNASLIGYRDLVPETFRLLADVAKADSQIYLDKTKALYPQWYASFTEGRLGAEHNMSRPIDAYQTFMAEVFFNNPSGDSLRKLRDIPWVSSDLFYLHKLSETVKAYNGVKWSDQVTASTPGPTSQSSASPPVKVGDIIQNNKVDLYDYNALLTDFGKKNDALTKADLDDDNDVDLYDYNILLTNFGR